MTKAAKKAAAKKRASHVAPFTPAEVNELYRLLVKDRPNPKTELNYTTPYTLLVAVVMSAQSTDIGVNKATEGLFREAATPEAMVKLGEAAVARHIKTIGFWRMKAKNVIGLSKQLIEKHGGKVPHDRAALEALPGVGRKTANVILMEIFDEGAIAVDTHVFRVSNRTGLAPGPTPEKVEERLMEVTPKKYLRGAHHWLLLHGRYVCIARKPKCPECAIAKLCRYEDKTPAAAP
jgi:endonuclease-3